MTNKVGYLLYIVNILNNKKSFKTLKVQSEFVKEGQKIQKKKDNGTNNEIRKLKIEQHKSY